MRGPGAVRLRLHGALRPEDCARIVRQAREALQHTRDRLVLDLQGLMHFDSAAAEHLAETPREHRARIRILAPASLSHPGAAAALSIFSVYQGPGLGLQRARPQSPVPEPPSAQAPRGDYDPCELAGLPIP